MAAFRAFLNSPVGPKITHFWGPITNWGFVVALKERPVYFLALGSRGLKAAPKLIDVLLTTDLKNVGRAGHIVKVKKGYARNMLIPNALALPNLDKYKHLVRNHLKELRLLYPEEKVEEDQESKSDEQKLKEINVVLKRLSERRVVIRRHVQDEATLRQPVAKSDLVFEVKRQLNVELQEVNLDMDSELRKLGEFEIPLRLPSNIELPGKKAKLFLKVKLRRA